MKKILIMFAIGAMVLGANAQIEVTNTGIGIGTASPNATLDILGKNGADNSRNFRVLYYGGGNLANTEFSALASVPSLAGGNAWTALYAKQGSASKAGVFDGDVALWGKIGIGTNDPKQRLHVVGNSFLNGNLGIGYGFENPVYKLEVNGTVFLGIRNMHGIETGVKIGTFTYNNNCSFGTTTAHAIYSTANAKLFLGVPTNWAYCTYSSNVYYTRLWEHSVPTNVTPCDNIVAIERITDDLRMVATYKAELMESVWTDASVRASDEGQGEYVFLAEQLQGVFPHLVSAFDCSEDGESKLAINYTGIIPIMTTVINGQQTKIEAQQETNEQQQREIEVLQQLAFGQEFDLTELRELYAKVEYLQNMVNEQQHTINELKSIVSKCCEGAGFTTVVRLQDSLSNNNNINNNTASNKAILYQITPNLFSSNTDIAYYIPAISNNAYIYIYNLQGTQVKSFPAVQGSNIVTIQASELPAGMYLYTLVVDNVILDSKRLILN